MAAQGNRVGSSPGPRGGRSAGGDLPPRRVRSRGVALPCLWSASPAEAPFAILPNGQPWLGSMLLGGQRGPGWGWGWGPPHSRTLHPVPRVALWASPGSSPGLTHRPAAQPLRASWRGCDQFRSGQRGLGCHSVTLASCPSSRSALTEARPQVPILLSERVGGGSPSSGSELTSSPCSTPTGHRAGPLPPSGTLCAMAPGSRDPPRAAGPDFPPRHMAFGGIQPGVLGPGIPAGELGVSGGPVCLPRSCV